MVLFLTMLFCIAALLNSVWETYHHPLLSGDHKLINYMIALAALTGMFMIAAANLLPRH